MDEMRQPGRPPGTGGDDTDSRAESWGPRYVESFSPEEIQQHRDALRRLTSEAPVAVLTESGPGSAFRCTIVAHDAPAVFSLIAGILGSCGMNILSGSVFTSLPAVRSRRRGRRSRDPLLAPKPVRRRIIDTFAGVLQEETAAEEAAKAIASSLEDVFRLLESGTREDALRARGTVCEMVARRLARRPGSRDPALPFYPVELSVETGGDCTTLSVRAQDTPFFLYSLANALSLAGISVERVRIRTEGGQVYDVIDILDAAGRRIEDRDRLDRLRFSVLLTKQFTFFLGTAPEPYTAMARFERLAEEVFAGPGRTQWVERFTDPRSLRDLAKVLGTSDYLWEDFIRTQYEELLPLLGAGEARPQADFSRAALHTRLHHALRGHETFEDRCRALNEWKDQEIFRIDLEHLLTPGGDVRRLAEPLSRLAEEVVQYAAATVFRVLVDRHGKPRTVGGIEAAYAVCGLGKFGGVALGYASDVELLFVYSDSGYTDGSESIANSLFFDRLVKETTAFIGARRRGVFETDLRLRPYGNSGPPACSLESFCRYYGPGGDALSYERLALVRLRAVAGDAELGRRIERLRDEFIYAARAVSAEEVLDLRRKQIRAKRADTRPNAKFSPGALVDLEYCVQLLQIRFGGDHEALRTPRIHEALDALCRIGKLDEDQARRLTRAYYFMRRLINGLRMLRGNALDLFLPQPDSPEYRHLARRMGYHRRVDLDAGQQLFLDFETQTAVIRGFLESSFGREGLGDAGRANIVDVILRDRLPAELVAEVFARIGFRAADRARENLRRLAGDGDRRDVFCRLAVLAGDTLRFSADPDMALNNWERFVARLPDPALHYGRLLLQPKRLDILLAVFSVSQFLAEILERNPDFLEWATDPRVLHETHDRGRLTGLLADFCAAGPPDGRPERVRRFRRREILRIATGDVCLGVPLPRVTGELSALADVLVEDAFRGACAEIGGTRGVPADALQRGLCILALGKLGGNELNYSSDIDLVAVADDSVGGGDDAVQGLLPRCVTRMREALTAHTAEGYLYRVDFRLRPYGRSGPLVVGRTAAVRYYRENAALWEIQALLKARPVAGALPVGAAFLEDVRPVLETPRAPRDIVESVRHMRALAEKQWASDGTTDVKSGPGGIRDVEFLVQALQLTHVPLNPGLADGNTLAALGKLADRGVLPRHTADDLAAHYAFLRRVEHFLQIAEDRQTHALPEDPEQLRRLARRLLGPTAGETVLNRRLEATLSRVRETYDAFLDGLAASG